MDSISWQENSVAIIPKIEFYINNTCNLTCNNCNRFNNHHFTGHQKWHDYSEIMAKWAQHIKINQVVIMGGEPLLNPTLIDWVKGLNSLWPQSVQILSNGTRLNHVKGLYDLLTYPVSPHSGNNWIGISWHNTSDDSILEEIHKFLQGSIKISGPERPVFGSETTFIDSNGVQIKLWLQNEFGPAAVHRNHEGKFTLFNNDPVQVHQGCGFAQFKCYHMIKGKLYKCGPVALFPEFNEQLGLDLSNEDRELINSYVPLSVEEFETNGQHFLKSIDDVLPQCKFCPAGWRYTPEVIYPTIKNTKYENINNIGG